MTKTDIECKGIVTKPNFYFWVKMIKAVFTLSKKIKKKKKLSHLFSFEK